VTTNDQYAGKARLLRSHRVERGIFEGLGFENPSFTEKGPWYYEMQALGYNYLFTELQSALGISQ